MPNKIKVLHLNASSGGGAFVVAQRLSEALNQTAEIESKHLVFTGKPGNYILWADNFWRKKFAFFLHALEKLDFLRFEKNKSVRFAFSHGKTGINIAQNKYVKEADIIHLHWINKGFISLSGLENVLKLGKPMVWTCHDQWPFTGGCYYSGDCNHYLQGCGNCPMLKNPAEKDLSKRTFQRKKNSINKYNNLHFISPTRWLADIGEASHMAIEKVIHVVPNCIDANLFFPENRNEIRDRSGISKKKYVILFAAVNIADKRKGFNEFTETMRILATEKPNTFEVVFVGENKDEIAESEGYSQRFTGYIADSKIMADWYKTADLYVTTSNDDNLPTTIMESMACGTPVAAFSVGGIPEMVENGETGVLVDVYDSEGLAAGILKLMRLNSIEIEKMQENCRNKVLRDYANDIVTKKHIEFYKNIFVSKQY